jgi:hypothetical protein
MEEVIVAHLGRWQMTRFGHQAALHVPPAWHGHRPLADACGTRANNFSIKK